MSGADWVPMVEGQAEGHWFRPQSVCPCADRNFNGVQEMAITIPPPALQASVWSLVPSPALVFRQ